MKTFVLVVLLCAITYTFLNVNALAYGKICMP